MVFIPGNHDEFARQFIGLTFGGIEIVRNTIHVAADGKRYLVMHGDEFDVVVRHSRWIAFLGAWAYDAVTPSSATSVMTMRFMGTSSCKGSDPLHGVRHLTCGDNAKQA